MLQHLSNDELTDLSLRSDEQALQPVREALSSWNQASSDRPEEFWAKQRAAVWTKIVSREEGKVSRRLPVLAWSAALLVLALSPLLIEHKPAVSSQSTQADPDAALLAQVEAEIDTEGPASLQPAQMLAEEIGKTNPSDSIKSVQVKEKNNQ
jgi:hypothetical protein